ALRWVSPQIFRSRGTGLAYPTPGGHVSRQHGSDRTWRSGTYIVSDRPAALAAVYAPPRLRHAGALRRRRRRHVSRHAGFGRIVDDFLRGLGRVDLPADHHRGNDRRSHRDHAENSLLLFVREIHPEGNQERNDRRCRGGDGADDRCRLGRHRALRDRPRHRRTGIDRQAIGVLAHGRAPAIPANSRELKYRVRAPALAAPSRGREGATGSSAASLDATYPATTPSLVGVVDLDGVQYLRLNPPALTARELHRQPGHAIGLLRIAGHGAGRAGRE